MSEFFHTLGPEILVRTGEHLFIALVALFFGMLVAIPVGILLTKTPKFANVVIAVAGLLQTIPTLALLALMIPFLGIGKLPAIIALFIYALLPILRNTYIGVSEIDPDIKDAAKGMGMTYWQSIARVELPLALPVIMTGVRLATVYVIAWTTLASYIGAGGLGDLIFMGLELYQLDYMLAGTLPVTILALLADYLLNRLEKYLTQKIYRPQVGEA